MSVVSTNILIVGSAGLSAKTRIGGHGLPYKGHPDRRYGGPCSPVLGRLSGIALEIKDLLSKAGCDADKTFGNACNA